MEKEVVESTTKENEERGLTVQKPEMYNMSFDLFDDAPRVKRICSLDLSDEKNADMVYNAQQEADYKLNDCVDKEIEVIGCVLTESPNETVNEETGEIITRKKHGMTLFDSKGKSYVTGSNSCYMSFMQIVALKGMPTKEKPLVLIPIKTPAKEKGHEYLKLKVKA